MRLIDIHERYRDRLLMFSGTREEHSDIIMEALVAARDIGIQGNIKFFHRQHHSKTLKEKANIEHSFKNMFCAMDDLSARTAKFWKDLDAKYRYHYKHIKRR